MNFDGLIEVRSCFPVPHKIVTKDDEATVNSCLFSHVVFFFLTSWIEQKVLVDSEFYQNMLELHNKAHPKEVIVGWYV